MMTSEFMNFQDFLRINTTQTHFYIDSISNDITCLRDDLQLHESIKNDFVLLKQLNTSTLEGNPFDVNPVADQQIKNAQLMILNDVAYELKIAKNDASQIVHYILMPFDIRIIENQEKFNYKKDSLTKRETQILSLFSKGLSMTKIAKELAISPHTVDSHRIKLCKKLNVRRTTQLAVWAYKLGLSHELDYQTVV